MTTSVDTETITQLESARKLALGDATYYPQIVPGVLPIIGAKSDLELRRWGTDFLAEAFASPGLPQEEKQKLSLKVLQALKQYLELPSEDATVVSSVVQIATSIYPLVLRYTIFNPQDETTWKAMSAIKSNILRRMDTAPAAVRVCCIKFAQRVVQAQTPGAISDPRRPDQNETSLSLVPRDHPLIPPTLLEPEAMGLLDRLLGVFQEPKSDAILVMATLNSIGVLVRTRASTSSRILNIIINFNPFKGYALPLSPRAKVEVRSMEKTFRSFLTNLNKRNPNHPLFPRVHAYIERLQQMRAEMFDEGSRKRPAPAVEPTDGLDQAKRQRLNAEIPAKPSNASQYPPLPKGRLSYAQLYTLIQGTGYEAFEAQGVPEAALNLLIVPVLARINQTEFDNAINAVRARWLQYHQPPPISPLDAAHAATGSQSSGTGQQSKVSDEAEQFLNQLEMGDDTTDLAGPDPSTKDEGFAVTQPPPLTENEVDEYGKGAINRVFSVVDNLQDSISKSSNGLQIGGPNTGFNRLAAANNDRDSWVTVVSRLATRPLAGLDNGTKLKQEGVGHNQRFSISDSIRDTLHRYVVQDFRRRIAVAISWLNEEWYNDKIQGHTDGSTVHYDKWALKVLDGIVPYLDAKDKILIRFLSEIPKLNTDLLERVKRLARDPERVSLAVNAIYYLVLFRPPVREICVDALEDLWRNYDDAKPATTKLLTKWRPQVLEPVTETVKSTSPVSRTPPRSQVLLKPKY